MNILFLGGDRRMTVAFDMLKKDFSVDSLGLFENDCGSVENADVLLFPVPTTRDGKTVNCPLTGREIPLSVIDSAKRGTLILTAGHDFKRYPQKDYAALDGFCLLNAAATAEGAVAAAVNSTDFTLFKSRILITGFGRVGKILLSRLSSFGADITVSARSEKDLKLLETLAVKHIKTADAAKHLKEFDIVFNTLDLPLFSGLSAFEKTWLFDLSTKGCTEKTAAGDPRLHIHKLPGIPGKTAPSSAGKIIAETVKNILSESAAY